VQPDEHSIMDVKEGDLIEVVRDQADGGSQMYRVMSVVPAEDGPGVMIETERWPQSLPGFYKTEVYPDTGNTNCYFG
jgi:hypothetical protein